MAYYFISDLHLSTARPDLAEGYFTFCRQYLKAADELFILGDFFDAWVGDDEDGTFYQTIKQQLASLNERNIRVSFMHGNRDFLVGELFAKQTHVRLLPDPFEIQLLGESCLLMHGDSLCIDDTDYMTFRAQVRSPNWQAQFLSLSLQQRRQIANDLRTKSKSMNSNKPEDIMDVSAEAVQNTFKQYNVSKIIHGHTHRPARHKVNVQVSSKPAGIMAERVVLGDWETHGWYLKVDKNEGMQLCSFQLSD